MRSFHVLLVAVAVFGAGLAGTVKADPASDAYHFASCSRYFVNDAVDYANVWVPGTREAFQQAKCKLKLTPVRYDFASVNDFTIDTIFLGKTPNLAKGVTGGTGAWNDPFVIDAREWNGDVPQACPAIRVTNVNAYVRITNNWFHDGNCAEGMVQVHNVRGVYMDNNRFSANRNSISATCDAGLAYRCLAIVNESVFEPDYVAQGSAAEAPAKTVFPGHAGWGTVIYASGLTDGAGLYVRNNDFRTGVTHDTVVRVDGGRMDVSSNDFHADGASVVISAYSPTDDAYLDVKYNTFKGDYDFALSVHSEGAGSPDILVLQNRFDSGGVYLSSLYGTIEVRSNVWRNLHDWYGMMLSVTTDNCATCVSVGIEDNTFYDLADDDAAVHAHGHGLVKNNRFWSTGPASASTLGLSLGRTYDPSGPWTVQGNDFGNLATDVHCHRAGTPVSWSSNTHWDGVLNTNC